MSEAVSVAEGLFTGPSESPQLVGGRCDACNALTFPIASGCHACGAVGRMRESILPTEGTLWTWTSQEFPPKEPYLGPREPETFTPWYVGLVEFSGEIRVEGRLVECDTTSLAIGQRMRTVVVPFARRDDGTEVLTFAFAPVGMRQADD